MKEITQENSSDCGVVGVPEDQLPVELPIDLPNHRSVSSLADIPDWSNTSCPKFVIFIKFISQNFLRSNIKLLL